MATKKQEDSLSLAQLRASQKRVTESAERLRELEIFNKMRRGEQLTAEERRAYQLKQRSQVPKPIPEQGTVGAVPPTQERLKELEIFNKMRRGEKLTPEEQRANQLRERSQVPLPRPEFRSPIDMVRDPGFDARMADQNYANLMRDQQARLAAQGQYTQGRLMGAPTEQPNPNAGKPLYFQALEGELQKQFLDKNPQLKPKPGTALNPQLMQENYAKFLQNQMAEVNKFNAANPQYAQDIRQPNPVLARQSEQSLLEGLLDYSKVSPDQVNVLNQLKSGYLNQGQGGGTQPSIPQYPQTETYNNLLQQGIQRSNTINQGAMTDFANMQAGAPTTQPAIPSPQLGGASAPQKGLPRPSQPKGFRSPIGRFA